MSRCIVHGAVDSLTGVYRRAGVEMVPTLTIPQDRRNMTSRVR